jgi:rhomboid protease GluP
MVRRTGSTLCPSCGTLVGVDDAQCLTCGRRNPGLWGITTWLRGMDPDFLLVRVVWWICGAVYLAGLASDVSGIQMDSLLSMLSPSGRSLILYGASGGVPVFGWGHWWTLLSACWIHSGLLHIGFNMMCVRDLAPPVAHLYGTGRTLIIYTVAGILGFLASSAAGAFLPALPLLHGSTFTLGASASIFGLVGALMHYGRRSGSSYITQRARSLALTMAIFGLIPSLGVDNYAHLGGFLGGWLAAKVLDPLHPERGDHLVMGAACLVLSIVSIVASVVFGLPLFSER